MLFLPPPLPSPTPACNNWLPNYTTVSPLNVEHIFPPLPTYLSNQTLPLLSASCLLFLSLALCKHLPDHNDHICHVAKINVLSQEYLHIWGSMQILQHTEVKRILPQPFPLTICYHLVLWWFSLDHFIWYHYPYITFVCGNKAFLDTESYPLPLVEVVIVSFAVDYDTGYLSVPHVCTGDGRGEIFPHKTFWTFW